MFKELIRYTHIILLYRRISLCLICSTRKRRRKSTSRFLPPTFPYFRNMQRDVRIFAIFFIMRRCWFCILTLGGACKKSNSIHRTRYTVRITVRSEYDATAHCWTDSAHRANLPSIADQLTRGVTQFHGRVSRKKIRLRQGRVEMSPRHVKNIIYVGGISGGL